MFENKPPERIGSLVFITSISNERTHRLTNNMCFALTTVIFIIDSSDDSVLKPIKFSFVFDYFLTSTELQLMYSNNLTWKYLVYYYPSQLKEKIVAFEKLEKLSKIMQITKIDT